MVDLAASDMTDANFRAAIANFVNAVRAGNLSVAQTELAAAEAINAALPVEAKVEGEGGGLVKRRETLEKLGAQLEQLRILAAGERRVIVGRVGFGNHGPRFRP